MNPVNGLAWSPDDETLLTCADRTIKVWKAKVLGRSLTSLHRANVMMIDWRLYQGLRSTHGDRDCIRVAPRRIWLYLCGDGLPNHILGKTVYISLGLLGRHSDSQ